MHQLRPARNFSSAIVLFFAAAFGLNGCSDTSSVTGPPTPVNPGPLTIQTPSPLPSAVQNQPYNGVALAATGGNPPYKWNIVSGSLPTGLNLNTSTGAITGTPTVVETQSPKFHVQDSSNPIQVNEKTLDITVNVAPTPLQILTGSPLPSGTINQSYFAALNGTGGTTPYTWGLKAGSPLLPPGLTLGTSNGFIQGTPTQTSSDTYIFTLKDATLTTVEKSLALTIGANPLSITTTSPLPQGTVTQNYSAQLAATGGTGSLTWSVSPALPTGLTLHTSTGVIDGIPTTTSNQNFTFTVTDQTPPTPQMVSKTLQLVVGAAPPTLTITSTSPLPPGTVTVAYSTTLTSTGGTGTKTWTISSGTLPAGLNLSSSGVISGTAQAMGTSSPTFQVKDSGNPQQTATKQLSITINNPAPPTITTTSLPDGTFNLAYNQTLAVTGGIAPLTWGVISGGLPNGLGLNSSTGTISGTATATGTFNFTVRVTDAIPQFDDQVLSITINPPPPPSITSPNSASLPTGTVNQAYLNTQLAATGGASPYTWTVSPALPNGLSLDLNTGVISGTPLSGSNGIYNPTFTVTDSTFPTKQTAQRSYSLTINANVNPVTIQTASLPNGTVCSAYSQSLAVTPNTGTSPYTWSLNSGSVALPVGLSLSAAGVITGTPTTAGTTPSGGPTFKVVDSTSPNQGTATKQLPITIDPDATLQITSTLPPAGTTTAAYSYQMVATGGCSPYTWSISSGSLPPPLTINPNTGIIDSGTPTATGTFNFTVRVTDSLSTFVDQALSIIIN